MNTSNLFDIIVIGASEEGINFCEKLINKTEEVNIALVSKNFNQITSKHNLANIVKIEQEVIHSSYNHGLFGVNLADRSTIYSKVVVLATGSKPIKSALKNSNIQYNISTIVPNKSGQAVVFGKNDLAVNYALKLAKKFKYVYLCSSSLDLECEPKLIKKLEGLANVLHLPNCNIVSCKTDKEGKLAEVQLDTYTSIKCTTLVMSLGRMPDCTGFSKRLIDFDSNGYISTKEYNETTKVPNLFAIGKCTKHSSNHSSMLALNAIIARNNFKLKEEI